MKEACRANNGLGGSLRFQANLPRGKRLDVSKALREEILSLEGIPTITVHGLLFDCLLFFFTSWKDSLTPDISLQAPQFSRWLMNMIIRTWSRNLIWKLNNAQFPVQKMLMRNGG
jgi:hypothetical protein